MATFFENTQVGTWAGYRMDGKLTGNVSRNGNTVTISGMVLTLRCPNGGAWGSDGWSFTVNGTATNFTVTAAGDGYSLGSYNLNSTSLSVSGTQTSASIGWRSGDGVTGSFTITFPAGYVAPNTPTISATATSPTTIDITYGTTSFGTPSTGTVYLYGGTSASPTTVINSKNTTGDSTYTFTGLSPETTYYFRSKANNGQLDSAYSTEVSVLTPEASHFYGSVSGQTKRIEKVYGSVSGLTKEVVKIYGSVNGQTKRIF